ncbi:PAS/PAC sensor hybrid histidine kinase [Desulfobulbus propionicus DSM 2032]|jgi:PAS domain S-box-containing protein|uniref:histidine kinase n=2 Tax=Desulfobulbus propionicus TaxID=894 RepID=A0A7U3YNH9_DESPD|nr:PAS/PAC sensor hybrid histidine kinase [Desulfobulbus propionicus DSM 2032]
MQTMHTVLIIDDEPRFSTSLEVLLKAEGYQVHVAYSGESAFHLLRQHAFSAALVDINLPDISGNLIASRIGKEHPETAVIILTGNATVDSAVESLRQGVYDYLRKPCAPDRLLQTLARGIQHKRLTMDLHNSEKRFRQLAQATWEGIIIYDRGTLLQTNSQLCKMFGYAETELLGKQIFDVLLDRNTIRALEFPADPETIGPFEARGVKKDGTTFPVEFRVKHIDYQGRQVQVAAIRDVTDSEIALKQKTSLMEKLADAQRMESLGLMASSVAHDLNNILAGIVTYPELLLMDLGEEFKYREELLMIREAGKRAAAVVNDLLTVARGATCKKEVQNVNDLITGYLNSVEFREISQRYPQIKVTPYLESALHNISCSTMHLTKSIMNLVNNAAEAIQARGQIILATKNVQLTAPHHGYETIEPGEYVMISVEDDGPGISPQDMRQIFSPFYSKKVMGRSGTGLGLAVVWNTIHDHGGFIDVISSTTGSTFSLYFPVSKFGAYKPTQPTPVISQYQGNGERVLVVDDQKSQREIASRLLSRLGYQPLTVPSGEEAVEYIKKTPVDLVILDMLMDPGINGCETYEQILRHVPGQKAIITSGYSNAEEINRAMNLGISQFVKKPYSLYELAQALKTEMAPPHSSMYSQK